jgi:hypothetical protein
VIFIAVKAWRENASKAARPMAIIEYIPESVRLPAAIIRATRDIKPKGNRFRALSVMKNPRIEEKSVITAKYDQLEGLLLASKYNPSGTELIAKLIRGILF